MVERGTGPRYLMEKVERMPRARLLHGCELCDVLCVESIRPFSGCPALPFIDQGGAGVTYEREREEKTKGRGSPSNVQGLPFPLSLLC